MDEELLTIHDVCAMLKMKPTAVRNLYKLHGMPVVRLSANNVRFKKSEVENWVANRTVVYTLKTENNERP